MAVLKGEGRVPILFGSWVLPKPPNRPAYLARPDAGGEHAVVVVAHDEAGITPGTRSLARHLARFGYAVIVPDMTRGTPSTDEGFEWVVSDLADAVGSARMRGTAWASESRIGLVGLGSGGLPAAIVAGSDGAPALAMVGGPIDVDLIADVAAALLVLQGVSEETVSEAEVRALQEAAGRGEWVLYRGVAADFMDEDAAGFDAAVWADGVDRMVGFFDRILGPVAAI